MSDYLVVIVLGVVALGAVAYPFIVGYARFDSDAELDAEVDRYRAAVAAGTVCPRCRAASAEGSRFCTECGRGLETD